MSCQCDHFVTSVDVTFLEPEFDRNPGLIPILQKAQALYGYLPSDLLAYIARRTGVKPSKVYGVVTFYAQFRTKPAGKYLILICEGTACHVNGSAEVVRAVGEYLGVAEGEVTADGLFSYHCVACLGCCSLSPVMAVGGRTYGSLTGEKAADILKKIRRGEIQID